jgi:proteic killer suppression protein
MIRGMIKSFACKETKRLFNREFSRKLPQDIQRVARRKLEILDAAEVLQDLRIPPSNRLKKLSGDRKGQYSVRINDQWRICFEWRRGDAYSVEIADYH